MNHQDNVAKSVSKVLIIENSRSVTGALKSAVLMTRSLKKKCLVTWITPSKIDQTIKITLEHEEIVNKSLCMLELSKSFVKNIFYFPVLIINSIILRHTLFKENISILIVNDYFNMIGVMAKILCWRGSLVYYVRLLPRKQNWLLNIIWSRLILIFADRVISVSMCVKEQFPKSKKVAVLYDPSDDSKVGLQALKSIEGDSGSVRFLYLSNFILGKGHSYALAAFERISRDFPNTEISFVGSDMGLEKNRRLMSALISEASEKKLGDRVRFSAFESDLSSLYGRHDIVLMFSDSESLSRVCLEAGVYGKPIIATRCGGPEEIVINMKTGILVPCADVAGMSEAMALLVRESAFRHKLGASARSLVRERFSQRTFEYKLFRELGLCFAEESK